MTDFYDWSTTASENANADSSINFAEFQTPASVNDSMRAVLARVAGWRNDLAPTRASTGSSNAYAVTSDAGGDTTYRDGEIVCFLVDRANTGASTLNVNARGAKPFRPVSGVEFTANELQADQPVIAFYYRATEEFLAVNTGYHVTAMTAGALGQSVAARLIKIGTPVLSIAPTAPAGYIRLTEATQTLNKSAWPELVTWLAGLSTPYPWGSTSTTFNLPPAAGYFLRFAGTSSTIDPDGARTAGSTQTDLVKAHTHTGTTSSNGAHTHTVPRVPTGDTTAGGSGGSFAARATATTATSSEGAHTHTFTTDANTGTENRPKNVAFHVDIFASSALSAGTLGMFGFPYDWDTGTTATDPGTALIRVNNATIGSATAIYVSTTDAWGMGLTTLFASITTGSLVRLSKIGAQANGLVMSVTGTSAGSGFYTITGTVSATSGTFEAADTIALEFWLATSGGGGSVATDAIWDAKGDIVAGTGPNAAARLAVGSNGQVLTADSAEATGVKWATPSSGGSISDGDKGDITVSASGATWTIDSNVISTFGRTITDDTSAGAMMTTLGFTANAQSIVTAVDYAAMRALLDLEVGTDFLSPAAIASAYQPLDSDLTSWAALTRASGFDTFTTTPSSANLASMLTDETGSGAAVFATSPTLVTPNLGTPSAINLTNGTALPVSGITASTSTALGVGSIELGHATDTTISRTAAGAIAVEGAAVKTAGKQEWFIPASNFAPRTSNGSAALATYESTTNKVNLPYLAFDATTQEFAQCIIPRMPKSWNEGTIIAIAIWTHPATTTNFGVVWGVSGVAISDADASDTAFGTAQTATDTGGTTATMYHSPATAAITIGGTPAEGDTIVLQVSRNTADASDTMAVDAYFHGLLICITDNAANDA